MSGSTHLRGIAIAGALAALALALGYVTLVMNQTASKAAPPKVILPLKDRHPASASVSKAPAKTAPKTATTAATTTPAKAKVKAKVKAKPKSKPVSPYFKAALAAGLPRQIAQALASAPVVVVELSSKEDSVATQAAAEAQEGAKLGGASFLSVDVDDNSDTMQTLARLLDQVPDAPAALMYTRPATLALTLTGFVDRTVIQQAVTSAAASVSSSSTNGASTTPSAATAGASA